MPVKLPDRPRWRILVHGGAKEIKNDERDANRDGVRQAVKAGAEILRQGGKRR